MMLRWLLLLQAGLLAACSLIPSPAERRSEADALAAEHGWQHEVIPTGRFDLVAYLPRRIERDDALTVYIEGDGFAWLSGSQPSSDPTPRDPLALRLALAHPQGNAAYLARPCQFGDAERSNCPERYWTDARFAPEGIDALGKALDALKSRFGARQLTLVGYSGGGAVAALLAARRSDVPNLITVAGNLDHRAWTAHHKIRPLSASLSPVDEVEGLRRVRQWHFVGERDAVIPSLLAESFAQRFPAGARPVVSVQADFDHRCCWADNWAGLWNMATLTPDGN